MTLPREVVPDRFHVISRRCMLRKFLLRPDAETNNAYIYCLGEAAQRFGIEVVLPTMMSNHDHVVVWFFAAPNPTRVSISGTAPR